MTIAVAVVLSFTAINCNCQKQPIADTPSPETAKGALLLRLAWRGGRGVCNVPGPLVTVPQVRLFCDGCWCDNP
ncbi:hypothetical protein BDP55DRAFT_662776 [Colletotrichum godetiae]|uniref:Secreted protein n=1 Tax=Colletotrichum godetiae TaxID=1209918 RepID=A0AAJ0AMF5_9PEZI|nr:uncharacterized protein BDP55DRAFT_662776 [Colletotrichum godetiae]KAK1675944.1 hypothetical protein BDP55DRAFT_662776 [Colletotrichum godetiae]